MPTPKPKKKIVGYAAIQENGKISFYDGYPQIYFQRTKPKVLRDDGCELKVIKVFITEA